MIDTADPLRKALENARGAYYQGDHYHTRYWARTAANIDPNIEEPWLWLAAVSTPQAAIAYLRKALQINPNSKRARDGMHWAIKRLRAQPILPPSATALVKTQTILPVAAAVPRIRTPKRRLGLYGWILIVGLLVIITSALVSPAMGFSLGSFFNNPDVQVAPHNQLVKASSTPTPTDTPTITPSPTLTSTPTTTPTSTPTDTPTLTPTPTNTPFPTYAWEEEEHIPVLNGERWIDVDLSDQMTYAYVGDEIVNSFVVSTGTWQHPTVTGQYYIYVKYLYSDMAGPGYYLPDVPYVMYFYDGYSLHGTYWHSNFGTPMSHGCVNLSIPDAEWLYNFSEVGTLVNVHD